MNPNIHYMFFTVSQPQFVRVFACLRVLFHTLEKKSQQDYFNKDAESFKAGEMRESMFQIVF